MAPEIEGYIQILDYMRDEVKKAIQGMTAEELNWAPLAKDTNSAAVLVTHLAGSESSLIHQVIGGVDIHRSRDAEFTTRASSVAELEAMLDRTGTRSREVLSKVFASDLGKMVSTRVGAAPRSLRQHIPHVIEHCGQHLGHISLTRQLYAARKS